jgi:hypothetical protein
MVTVSDTSTIKNSAFCIYVFHMILNVTKNYFLNYINHLIFAMENCVFWALRAESVNII